MATPLPNLNNPETKLEFDTKTFVAIAQPFFERFMNFEKITEALSSTLITYELKATDIFKSIDETLQNILKTLTTQEKIQVKGKKETDLKEKQNSLRTEEDSLESPKKKSVSEYINDINSKLSKSFKTMNERSSFLFMALSDPRFIAKAVGGTTIASAFMSAIKSPLAILLSSAAAGFLQGMSNSEEMAKVTNNSEMSQKFAQFFTGTGGNSIIDKISQYGKWAAMGAAVGLPFGPLGALAGGIIGSIVGVVFDYFGDAWLSDKIELARLNMNKMNSYLFGGDWGTSKDELDKIILETTAFIERRKQELKDYKFSEQIEAVDAELARLKGEGLSSEYAIALKRKEDLLAKKLEIENDLSREMDKLNAAKTTVIRGADEGVFDKMANWLIWWDKESRAFGANIRETVVGTYSSIVNTYMDWNKLTWEYGGIIRTKITDFYESVVGTYNDWNKMTWEYGASIREKIVSFFDNVKNIFMDLISYVKDYAEGLINFLTMGTKGRSFAEIERANIEKIVNVIPKEIVISPQSKEISEKSKKIRFMAEEANKNGNNSVGSLMTSFNNMMKTVVNNNVDNKTVISRPINPYDNGGLSGYGRGE